MPPFEFAGSALLSTAVFAERPRLTAIGRRRGIIAKKKSAKKKWYWARGAGAPADKNKFRNHRARESAGGSLAERIRSVMLIAAVLALSAAGVDALLPRSVEITDPNDS
jgi:hypothetical protein